MSTKPILFNTEMVRAILDGRKTVTRRIANINTEITCGDGTKDHEFVLDNFSHFQKPTGFVCRRCGFGVAPPHSRVPCGSSFFIPRYWPGDILYVRETWQKHRIKKPQRAVPADFKEIQYSYRADGELANSDGTPFRWRPSIHMPKEAARIFLRVKNVRVERLQDITADECPMEGVWPLASCTVGERDTYYRSKFAELWDSTIKPADMDTYGWEANPWVWVIKFEKISKEEVE